MKHISDVLREERIKKGLSIDDVVAATKIRKNFVIAMEEGKFHALPSETYAQGFVKNYANFLNIPESRASALFRREYDADKTENSPKFRKAISHSRNSFSLRSSRSVLGLIVVFVVLAYIIYQFNFLVLGPKLELASPQEGSIAKSNVVVVSGKTDPSASVYINDESVYVDLAGNFKKTLYIEDSSDTTVKIIAKNSYGKQTEKEVHVQLEQ